MDLPTYFPVSSTLLPQFENLRDNSTALDDLRETQSNILKAADTYLNLLFPQDPNDQWSSDEVMNMEPIKELLDAFEKLTKAQQQTCVFNNAFNDTKNIIRERIRSEPELTLQNIDTYRSLNDKKSFSELLDEKLQKDLTTPAKNNSQAYVFLKNATFVIEHPLDPLPDEEQDDDLEVEGGKVDLKCPISMDMFHNPMISIKCGHTFDKASIEGHWKHRKAVEDCPILGCSRKLGRADFKPDKLMALRVKSFKAQQQKLENAQVYDRLD